jgi:UDPglucose--hexose-1-phosphate uridylyltransferase
MSELRKDPVTGRWVIIASERAKRPRQHSVIDFSADLEPCPFCPGNEAMTPAEVLAYRDPQTQPNSPGWHVRVVPNKYPALERSAVRQAQNDGLYESMNGVGVHEVIIESSEHVTDIGRLSEEQIALVLRAYGERLRHWRQAQRWRYLLLDKNQGERAGATLEHVHSQLVALASVPKDIVDKTDSMLKHYASSGRCIYCEMIERAIDRQECLVSSDEHFIVLCPFAPRFAYETWILPRDHAPVFEQISDVDIIALARALRDTFARLNLATDNPPFNYVIHTGAKAETASHHYHWHMEIMPQLTRAAGFEWGTGTHINPVAPEAAARLLRDARI